MEYSNDTLTLGYDPYDDNSETGYRRPPRLAGCLTDYFMVIQNDCTLDNPFPHREFEAMLSDPDAFFTPCDAIIAEVKTTGDPVAVLTSRRTGKPIPRIKRGS